MSTTVGKDSDRLGRFAYKAFAADGSLAEFGGDYPTFQEAQAAAQNAERELFATNWSPVAEALRNDWMDLDDTLSELQK